MVANSATRFATSSRLTLLAFGGVVVIAAANLVAVRFTTSEIPPFFGAAFRFGVAGVVLICAGLVARLPNPTRRELIGTLLYGLLAFGGAMALGYWALQELPAAIGGTIIATVPVITILLARVQGLETFQWRGLAGGLLTVAGIWFLVSDSGAGNVPLGSGLAMVGGAVCMAEAGIVVKKFPPCHPVVFNGLAMGAGALVLLGVSLSAGEQWAMPSSGDIWLAMAFMILAGSIALFGLYLFVLKSWTASAASFQFVLIPLATALLGFWILDEPVGGRFFVGAGIVLAGVYIGALSANRPPTATTAEQEAFAQRCSTT